MTNDQLMMLTLRQLTQLCREEVVNFRTGNMDLAGSRECVYGFYLCFKTENKGTAMLGFHFNYAGRTRLGIVPSIDWYSWLGPQQRTSFMKIMRQASQSTVYKLKKAQTWKTFFRIPDPEDKLQWQKAGCVMAIQLTRGLVQAKMAKPYG